MDASTGRPWSPRERDAVFEALRVSRSRPASHAPHTRRSCPAAFAQASAVWKQLEARLDAMAAAPAPPSSSNQQHAAGGTATMLPTQALERKRRVPGTGAGCGSGSPAAHGASAGAGVSSSGSGGGSCDHGSFDDRGTPDAAVQHLSQQRRTGPSGPVGRVHSTPVAADGRRDAAAMYVPVEAWELVLSYLDWPEWIAASGTCRALRIASASVRLWQRVGMDAVCDSLRDVKLRLQQRYVWLLP